MGQYIIPIDEADCCCFCSTNNPGANIPNNGSISISSTCLTCDSIEDMVLESETVEGYNNKLQGIWTWTGFSGLGGMDPYCDISISVTITCNELTGKYQLEAFVGISHTFTGDCWTGEGEEQVFYTSYYCGLYKIISPIKVHIEEDGRMSGSWEVTVDLNAYTGEEWCCPAHCTLLISVGV